MPCVFFLIWEKESITAQVVISKFYMFSTCNLLTCIQVVISRMCLVHVLYWRLLVILPVFYYSEKKNVTVQVVLSKLCMSSTCNLPTCTYSAFTLLITNLKNLSSMNTKAELFRRFLDSFLDSFNSYSF